MIDGVGTGLRPCSHDHLGKIELRRRTRYRLDPAHGLLPADQTAVAGIEILRTRDDVGHGFFATALHAAHATTTLRRAILKCGNTDIHAGQDAIIHAFDFT